MTHQSRRPDLLNGVTRRIKTGCGNIYININFDKFGYPVEVICNMAKAGGCASAQAESTGRMISLILRKAEPKHRLKRLDKIVEELRGINCNMPTLDVKSCADGIAIALDKFMEAKR